jgi:hypothetical protein
MAGGGRVGAVWACGSGPEGDSLGRQQLRRRLLRALVVRAVRAAAASGRRREQLRRRITGSDTSECAVGGGEWGGHAVLGRVSSMHVGGHAG